MPKASYIIGDIHGQFKKLTMLLQRAKLIGRDLSWCGDNATLYFLGDYFDRGPNGTAVINLIMRLQREAEVAGGAVHALLGNHDVLILAVQLFGKRLTGMGTSFSWMWKQNGGNPKDLKRLTSQHREWLISLPAIALSEDALLMHADALLYAKYGQSVEEVNATFKKILSTNDSALWDELLEDFANRGAFVNPFGGDESVHRFLTIFGAKRIVHGHTPIYYMLGVKPKQVTEAWTYANGLCTDVDGAIFAGGPGFVYQLPRCTT